MEPPAPALRELTQGTPAAWRVCLTKGSRPQTQLPLEQRGLSCGGPPVCGIVSINILEIILEICDNQKKTRKLHSLEIFLK